MFTKTAFRIVAFMFVFTFILVWTYQKVLLTRPQQQPAKRIPLTTNRIMPEEELPEEELTAKDFNFVFDSHLQGLFPKELELYELSFIVDRTGSKHEVGEKEARDLANRLGIEGEVFNIKPGEFFRIGYTSEALWFVGDASLRRDFAVHNARADTPFLEVHTLSGAFYYQTGKHCGDEFKISSSTADKIAKNFISTTRILDLEKLEVTTIEPRNLNGASIPGCYEVFFSNVLPINQNEIAARFAPYTTYEPVGLFFPPSYNSRGAYVDGLSVSVDPKSGEVVSISSGYRNLISLGMHPLKSRGEIEQDLSSGKGDIFSYDFEKNTAEVKDGKIMALVKFIYPYYLEQKLFDGQLGSILNPVYYVLAQVQLNNPDSPKGYLLIAIPAIR